MTDTADNVVAFKPRRRDRLENGFPLDQPMMVDSYISAIFSQVLLAYPDILNVDLINFAEIERVIRSIAYHGILGEEPRRLP